MLGDFHFLRPWWLLAILSTVVCWYLFRRYRNGTHAWKSIIAPHLLPYLLKTDGKQFHRALDLAMFAGCLGAIAAAGPTWFRAPTPFADDTAAIAIVIKVTPSMLTEDVQPSRLARSVEKIHDLLHQRGSAKTCLIAYSGTAHLVMPATTDGNIINTFAQSLDPEIMPVEGDAAAEALQLADQALSDCGGGSVWWITDDIPQDQVSKLQKWFGESKSRVNVLPAIAPGREADLLAQSGRDLGADVVALSADDSDIGELAKLSNFKPTLGDDEQGRWADSGYWLTPLLVILLLPLFRRGTSALGH